MFISQGDIQAAAIDLILASFDILANAVFRRETHKTGHLLRSYLINKVPLLLANLATSMFPPLTPQFCIAEALGQIDANAFPSMSEMFDLSNDNRDSVTENVRADFCFACCLHGLISEDSINSLIGDMHYQTLPAGGRYNKDTLVAECMTDPERVQKLIGEMDNYDGNVGAACQAVTEVRCCYSSRRDRERVMANVYMYYHAGHRPPLRGQGDNDAQEHLRPTGKEAAVNGRHAAL